MSVPSESFGHPVNGSSLSFSRDSEFFIDVKPLYLRAETTLFCVPRHYFQTSDVFDGMFTLPDVPNAPQEGASEENPLFLESIKADELREFLRVLSSTRAVLGNPQPDGGRTRTLTSGTRVRIHACHYCRFATSTKTTIRSIRVTRSWLPVLKLASLWQFASLREKALKCLKSADCVTRLHIARQYGAGDWFLPAVRDLIVREEPLAGDEMGQLGLEFAAKVVALREEARGPLITGPSAISDSAILRRFEGKLSDTAASAA
ncbi:hypothetical protein GSI_04793 [Ganoderma sinense ZZ0214-1]|uniref:BTB domain-containing protein n=1 Tax=Ganoderma sinense ZZ0214-1 TaxID=1077348 RepID=A0A2G8SHV5_9APHY|nr:hypothetical protein GSI_04793 [Ganoderma sinense ZZ0214-1]